MTLLLGYLLLGLAACAHCQISLVQSGNGNVKPNEVLKLTCKVNGYTITTGYWWSWNRQTTEKGLEWLGLIKSDGAVMYNSAFQSRISVTRDTTNNEYSVQLSNMRSDDSGTYYCARITNWLDYWGQGTFVTVTTVTQIVPHVYPLVQYGIGESPSVTFGCLVDKYFPEPATISWSTTSGGIPTDVKTFPSAQIADPISYHRSSQVTVSKNDWESNTYLCTVSHNSSNYQTAIPKGCHDPLSAKLLQGSCPENSASHTVELVCQISNVISQNYQVKWFINGKETTLEDKVTQVGTSSYTRTVNVKQAEWNSAVSFMCQVHDSGNIANDTIRKCSDALNCFGINVFIMRPTVEDLFVHKIARITCLASNIPSNTGYQFRWFQGEEQSSMYSTEDAILNQNGTYSVSSVLTTSTDAWDSKTKYTCTFTDNMLRSPVIKTISKDLETKLFPPSVAVLPPTPEEISLKERVTFTCVVHGFYPMDIYMGWSKDDIETPKELYVTSDPKVDNNQRYFAVSKMTVPFTDWDDDKPYTCVVGHEALPLYFTQRTIDKTTGKPTNVHVNVYMSDSQLSWP